MKLLHSQHFRKRLAKRVYQNQKLKKKISKQLKYLRSSLTHPSLKTHRLKGVRAQEYAIWIEGNIRITFILIDDEIILTDIITHDEY